MNYRSSLTWACLLISIMAQGQKVVDGPYVRYENGQVVVTEIKQYGDLLKPESQTYLESSKADIVLNVIPQNHADWTFTVKLRQKIENDVVSYAAPSKTLFLSDIEGEFANFRQMLLAAKVIDEHYNWTFGDGSLVIAGDLFDHGKDVVPELWLLYKLEDESKASGGSVDVVLGNHDIMNLSGDHRYTDMRYFKNAWLLHTDCTGLFSADTELGRWLRSKNIIERIGDVLVMHGRMSPVINQMQISLEQLNAACHPYYDKNPVDMPSNIQPFFSGKTALFWYRGYFMQPRIRAAGIDSTLKQYDCNYILVGHTIVKKNIAMYYGGKLIGIDVDEHEGVPSAAYYEQGGWQVIDDKGKYTKLEYKPANDTITDADIL